VWYLLLSPSEVIALRNSTFDSELGRRLGSYLPLLLLGKDSGQKDRISFLAGQLELHELPPKRLRRYPLNSISRIVVWMNRGVIDIHTIEGTYDRYRSVGATSFWFESPPAVLEKFYLGRVRTRED
jgi:hypothetical protein